MSVKNPYGKSRKVSEPYFVLESNGWKWNVLKLYKGPEASLKDPFARAFCSVSSPYCPGGEMGDVYVKEIPGLDAKLREAVSKEAA